MPGISALKTPLSTVRTFAWPELYGALSPWIAVAVVVVVVSNKRDDPQAVVRITRSTAHHWLALLLTWYLNKDPKVFLRSSQTEVGVGDMDWMHWVSWHRTVVPSPEQLVVSLLAPGHTSWSLLTEVLLAYSSSALWQKFHQCWLANVLGLSIICSTPIYVEIAISLAHCLIQVYTALQCTFLHYSTPNKLANTSQELPQIPTRRNERVYTWRTLLICFFFIIKAKLNEVWEWVGREPRIVPPWRHWWVGGGIVPTRG